MFKKTTLKNGLRIITVPRKNTQAVTVLALVGTGSKHESKEINGISHFLEHMFFKGTKKRPSPMAVAETMDGIGGIFNAFTGEEYTGYFAKVEAAQFELALDWVSDIFLNSTLPPKEIEKEKGVIIEEINMIQDQPIGYVQILWNEVLYGNQPAGWSIAGTKGNIRKMTRQKLRSYRNKKYSASNTIVCVAGRVDGKIAEKMVKKYFSGISSSSLSEKPKVVEKQVKPQILARFKKTDQTNLCLGVRTCNLFHPNRYPLEVLSVILGGMMSSRLFVEIREKLGLAYYVKTSVELNPDTGFLVTQAGVDNKNVERAILAILNEYKKMSQEIVSGAELKRAKDNIRGKMALLLESSNAISSFYATQELLERDVKTAKQIFKEIDKVSANDILRVSQEIFRPENLNLAIIGPLKNEKNLKKILHL